MRKFDPFQFPSDFSGPPRANQRRQAVSALQGYAYQIWVTALAWVRLKPFQRLYIEVAEDYALVRNKVFEATQVKHAKTSRKVTLNDQGVKDAITSLIELRKNNPAHDVSIRYFTTMDIGHERDSSKYFGEKKGLEYWRSAADGKVDVTPIRKYLTKEQFSGPVKNFIQGLSDTDLCNKLVSRISWDCGQPSFSEIENEVVRSLEDIAIEHGQFLSRNAQKVANALCNRILSISTKECANSRMLRFSDLEHIIHSTTAIQVPEVIFNKMLDQNCAFQDVLFGQTTSEVSLSTDHGKWLYKGSDLLQKRGIIRRMEIERRLGNAVSEEGVAILTGSKGLGKSVTSRSFAQSQYDEFYIVECGDSGPLRIRHILNTVARKVTDFHGSILILENFNAIENSDLRLSLEYVITESRKYNVHILLTCYAQPPLTTLVSLGIDKQVVVECDYFSKDEIKSLIRAYSGDAEGWSRQIYVRSDSGHPTMVHGLITSLASRNWPENEKTLTVNSDRSTQDYEREHALTRKRIVLELPSGERDLLYRLSLITGPFDRHLALALSQIEPALTRAGESIDHLIGPWIEELSSSRYRISSLISGCGKEMFSEEELRCVHECIVDQLVREEPIEIRDIERVLLHAIYAEKSEILFYMARGILVSDSDMIRVIARESTLVQWRTDKPIFEKEPFASVYLRLAQFKLSEATGDQDRIHNVVDALCGEIELIPADQTRKVLWIYAIGLIVQSPGIAYVIDDWVSLLMRLISISRTLQFWREDFDGTETVPIEPKWDGFSVMFSDGILGIHSVAQFETIVDQLCEIPPESRSLLLQPVDEFFSDYFELVRHAWLQDREDPNYDAEDALQRYGRIAKKTSEWEEQRISLQAYAVQSAILDHDLDDPSRGLTVVQNAAKIYGNDPILVRSMGQICLRKHDYEQAFTIYGWLVKNPGTSNPSRKAHTFREAARAATHCDNLELAEKWFMAAANVAEGGDLEDLNALSLGLKADAVVMALRSGHASRALTRLGEVVEALTILDPDTSLRTRYTHATVRHVISEITSSLRDDIGSTGHQLINIEPGICSVPEPSDIIRQHPLGHIDYLWYMLSEVELISRKSSRIYQSLPQKIRSGPISGYEVNLRIIAMWCRIEDLDATGVVACLEHYIEAAIFALGEITLFEGENEAFSPIRGKIPAIPQDYYQNPQAVNAIKDVIVAFLMRSVMADDLSSIKELKNALISRFDENFPCIHLLENALGMPRITEHLESQIAKVGYQYSEGRFLKPKDIWIVGMYFFEWTSISTFRNSLSGELVKWLQFQWRQIINEQRFFLNKPSQTVPLIEQILDDTQGNLEFITRLLLVASEAVGIELTSAKKQLLKKHISERSAPSYV